MALSVMGGPGLLSRARAFSLSVELRIRVLVTEQRNGRQFPKVIEARPGRSGYKLW
jgi:hypothetical protein